MGDSFVEDFESGEVGGFFWEGGIVNMVGFRVGDGGSWVFFCGGVLVGGVGGGGVVVVGRGFMDVGCFGKGEECDEEDEVDEGGSNLEDYMLVVVDCDDVGDILLEWGWEGVIIEGIFWDDEIDGYIDSEKGVV